MYERGISARWYRALGFKKEILNYFVLKVYPVFPFCVFLSYKQNDLEPRGARGSRSGGLGFRGYGSKRF